MPESLSIDQARRLALAAQGVAARLPARRGPAAIKGVLGRLGAIQIDSINVVARSHELVVASRVGAYDPKVFDRAVYRQRAGWEFWGHAASFLPIETYRLFLPKMERLAADTRGWFTATRTKHAELYPRVLDRIKAEGPLPASAFREPDARRRGTWWDWAPAKHVLEDLFDQGVLLVHDRANFERRYDLAERVLPPGLDTTPPAPEEASRELLLLAARAYGVATSADLVDYFRLPPKPGRGALAELVASGELQKVRVEGWKAPAFLIPGTPLPRKLEHPPVLLSPFDSLLWYRDRAERLFGFRYRLEVYVPEAKRVDGYYTMPVLAAGRFLARVDPKHDRPGRRLVLRRLRVEEGANPVAALAATAEAAWRLARHLGADDVTAGDAMPAELSVALRAALAAAIPAS